MSDNEKPVVDEEEIQVKTVRVGVGSQKYKDSQSSAEDNKSSGWVLLFVGVAGIIAVILCMVGVIPLKFANPYLFYGVFIAVFVLFLVMGVVSFANAKKFEVKANSENTLKEELIKWTSKNLTAEIIDKEIDDSDKEAEEVLYFKRSIVIASKLNNQFVNLDPFFLENLIDNKLYEMLFPESLTATYDEYEEDDEDFDDDYDEDNSEDNSEESDDAEEDAEESDDAEDNTADADAFSDDEERS